MQAVLLTTIAATLLTDAAVSMDLKERPVAKVINLLKEMQGDLSKEAEADTELYEKLSCWCTTNGGDKTAAIAEANRRIEQLTADIERFTATSEDLTSSIATLNEEIAKNKDALASASEMRAKDLADFNAEEKDMIASIRSLGGAVTALGKHQGFLQTGDLRKAVALAELDAGQREEVESFLQQAPSAGSYASQSGAIFGILEQMKETFETNLATSQKEEADAAAQFADLKASKTKELDTAAAQVDSQTQELASTDEANAAAQQNLKDTQAALASDTAFLKDLKERCATADAEYETRSKTRNEEIKAISETIGILNSDESHDLMGSTLGFLQKEQVDARKRAARSLASVAAKTGSRALLALSAKLQLDAFKEVHAAIDEMVTALKQEMADEVKHKDFCTAELAENDEQSAVAQDELEDLTASIASLESDIDTLTKELNSATKQVKEMKTEMQRASENRESENAEFQATVADQRAVQQILQKAFDRMKQFYGEQFLQVSQEPGAAVAPPPPSATYKKSAGGGGVMGLLSGILAEAKGMELEALRDEADSQAAYEAFMKDSNDSIATLNKAITDKTSRKATATAELVAAKNDQTKTLEDLEMLHEKAKTLHSSCDFVLENFDARQAARGAEIQALGEAKAILSGA